MKIHILSEGDDWFVSGKDIIRNLENIEDGKGNKRFKVKKMADKGEQAIDMLSGGSKLKLAKYLKKKRYDILLFSGGLNDLFCKSDFALFIEDYEQGTTVESWINHEKLDRRINMILRAVTDLVDFTLEYHPDGAGGKRLKVVTHTYDLSDIDESEEIWSGDYQNTWLNHIFSQKKGFPETDFKLQKDVVHYFIKCLRTALLKLEQQLRTEHEKQDSVGEQLFFVADTHNTLALGDWSQELLPNNQGIKKLTYKIVDGIDLAL